MLMLGDLYHIQCPSLVYDNGIVSTFKFYMLQDKKNYHTIQNKFISEYFAAGKNIIRAHYFPAGIFNPSEGSDINNNVQCAPSTQ